MDTILLKEQINFIRNNLSYLLQKPDMVNYEVILEYSQKLDELIVQYQKIYESKNEIFKY